MKPQWYRLLNQDTRKAFWTTFSGFVLAAMNVQLYAFVLPVLMAAWGLSHTEAGLLATVTLVSSAIGGWTAGLLADRFGRIRLLKFTILWLAISTSLCGLAANFDQLMIARSLQGFGFGAEWAVGAVFIAEVAVPEARGRTVGMLQSSWAVGWGLAAALSTAALLLLPADLGWRAMFIMGLPPAILVFLFRLDVKESEAFLAGKRRSSWRAIFSASMAPSTFKGSVLATGMHGGFWAIATWWPTILRSDRGFSTLLTSVYVGALVVGSFFGYLFGSWLGDRFGRKVTLVSFALGGTFVLLLCTESHSSDLGLLLLSFPLGFFALGIFSVIGSVLTELYPTEMRGSGLGFCYNFGRGMAGLAPLLIGGTVEAIGFGHALGICVAIAYGLVVLAALSLPETRGRPLIDIPTAVERPA